jgi:hypothetical protein
MKEVQARKASDVIFVDDIVETYNTASINVRLSGHYG